MSVARLPPVEKLPLAVRKSLRDEWESKNADFESQLSKLLGEPWTIEVDPNSLYPYATEDWAKNSFGSVISGYFDGAIFMLRSYVDNVGADWLNEFCPARILTLDVDLDKRFTYVGADVDAAGRLRMLFTPGQIGVNQSDALSTCNVHDALAAASSRPPANPGPLGYLARVGIKIEYDPKADALRSAVAAILASPDIKLNPNFEAVYAKMKAAAATDRDVGADWERNLGSYVAGYWDGLVSQLRWKKFDEDDMLRDGFNYAIDKNEIGFRVVDALDRATYCEVVVEEGVLWLQTVPRYFGVNTTDAADKIIDVL